MSDTYKYCSVQLDLPSDIAERVVNLALQIINKDDVVEFEKQPHVTVQYGIKDNDVASVQAALQDQYGCDVELGSTDYFSNDDGDVVFVSVTGDGLSRLRDAVRDKTDVVDTRKRFVPHVTLAYVKKDRGQAYAGNDKLSGVKFSCTDLSFCSTDGSKTPIELAEKKANSMFQQPGVTLGVGSALGGLGGRFIGSPILERLGFDPSRSRTTMTLAGILLGSLPGLLQSSVHKKLYGGYFNTPAVRNFSDWRSQMLHSLPQPEFQLPAATPVHLPDVLTKKADGYNDQLWRPSFSVSTAMDEIERNPYPNLMERVKMKQLIAQAGHEQGVGLTGGASPGSLLSALPDVIGNAIPTVGAAYAVSSALGAPSWFKNTALGAATIYSALKGFMKGANVDSKQAFKVGFLTKMAELGYTPDSLDELITKQANPAVALPAAATNLAGTAALPTSGEMTTAAIASGLGLSKLGPTAIATLLGIPFIAGAGLGSLTRKGLSVTSDNVDDLRKRDLADYYRQMTADIRRRSGITDEQTDQL